MSKTMKIAGLILVLAFASGMGSSFAEGLPAKALGTSDAKAMAMLASRVLSDRLGSPVEVVDSAIEPNDASSKFVQLQVRQATVGGKSMELGKSHRCQEDFGADSPLAYVVFKREGREWVSKGAVVCSTQSASEK